MSFIIVCEANKMIRSKEAMVTTESSHECCMCGDYGFSYELFQCKVCQFRSQHRYCSNLYPKEESYQVCNWCLSQDDTKEKSQNSSNSSSSHKNNCQHDTKFKRNNSINKDINHGGLKGQRSNSQLQLNSSIKKQSSPERSHSTRRRIITNGKLEEKLRRIKSAESLTRIKSEEIPHRINGNTRHVFKNKVRRYKLLDEVSS